MVNYITAVIVPYMNEKGVGLVIYGFKEQATCSQGQCNEVSTVSPAFMSLITSATLVSLMASNLLDLHAYQILDSSEH